MLTPCLRLHGGTWYLTAAANTSAADAVPLSTKRVRGSPCACGPASNVVRPSTEPFLRMMNTTSWCKRRAQDSSRAHECQNRRWWTGLVFVLDGCGPSWIKLVKTTSCVAKFCPLGDFTPSFCRQQRQGGVCW